MTQPDYRSTPIEPFTGDCLKCGLYAGCHSGKMPGEGSDHPIILFVGEAPGETEDNSNRVFVGSTGKLLKSVAEQVGIDLSQCRFTNTVRCRPPNNRTPKANEIKYCSKFLQDEIAQVKPKVIVLLGGVPLKSVLNETGITAWNGTVIKRDGISYVPAFHPSYIMRQGIQGESLDNWLRALMNAKTASEDGITDLDYNITVPETIEELDYHLDRLIAEHIRTGVNIAYDVETRWLYPEKPDNTILMFSLAVNNDALVVPLYHNESWFRDRAVEVLARLKFVLTAYPITGHNVRFDQRATRVLLGIDFKPAGDTLNISRLLNAHDTYHGLKRLAALHLNLYDYDKEVEDYQKAHPEADPSKPNGDFGKVPLSILLPYSGLDSIACSLIEQKLEPKLSDKQRILYHQLTQPVSSTLGRMEQNGFFVDRTLAERYATVYKAARARYYQQLIADDDVAWYIDHKTKEDKKFTFNPASDVQMREIIFGVKGYKVLGLTDTGLASVSWDEIKVYKDKEPFFPTFRMWSLLDDILSKYFNPPIQGTWFFGGDDRGRVNFNLGGASSGRLSSSKPTNFQNIPTREKEWGTLLMYKPVKNIFTASAWADMVKLDGTKATDVKGHFWSNGAWVDVPNGPLHPYKQYDFPVKRGRLVMLDYNGQELRVMASIANVPGMIKAFNENRDIHSFVTSLLFHIREDLVKSQYNHLRYRAKWVNWTLLFGGDEYTLVNLYGLSLEEARAIIKAYYTAFPEVLAFQKAIKKFVAENGYVESIMGRRLKLHYTTPEDRLKRQAMYNKDMRTAINMPIQGPASDLLLMALNIIQDNLIKYGYRSLLVNTVHDSIVLDSPEDEVEPVTAMAVSVMESLPDLSKVYYPDIDLSWLRVNLKADADAAIWYGEK